MGKSMVEIGIILVARNVYQTKDLLTKLARIEKIIPDAEDYIFDFAECLKKRLIYHRQDITGVRDFIEMCEMVSTMDMADPDKVHEVYGKDTSAALYQMIPYFAEKLCGKSFAEEARKFMDVRELV